MENQHTPQAPASDTAASEALEKFVAENRQRLPALAARIEVSPIPPPETEAAFAEREKRDAERAELRRQGELRKRWIDLLQAAGHRYREATLASFECQRPAQTAVVSALREYIETDSPAGIVLYGPVGTGKDHLAFSVCRAAIKAGKTVRWVNGQSWFGLVRDAMDTARSEASLIAELTRCDVLCLSDPLPPVGALTQFQATMLYRLVDARYSRGVPTICTINVASDEEADERMGAATWDRLTHDAWKLHCSWPTYRKPARVL